MVPTLITIGVIGNPNTGKSTLFNALSGLNQRTGNWPGITVEKIEGIIHHHQESIKMVDLPGLYSLGVGSKKSTDQQITISFLNNHKNCLILNVIDSLNLQRNLYLTLQLLEKKANVLLVLNMTDLACKNGCIIDDVSLSNILHVPVIKISANHSHSVHTLKTFLFKYTNHIKQDSFAPFTLYGPTIQRCYQKICQFCAHSLPNRYAEIEVLTALEDGTYDTLDIGTKDFIRSMSTEIFDGLQQKPDHAFINARYSAIENIVKRTVKYEYKEKNALSDKIDLFCLHKFIGIIIFLFITYCMFFFTIKLGGIFQECFSIIAEITFVDVPLLIIKNTLPNIELLNSLISGLGGGIQTICGFIPIIAAMYIFLSFLEDSGYMPRAAVITNKLMQRLGLSGKAFLPLIIGFGCNVPSIIGTRILRNHRERAIAIMISPFISCSARFMVYMLFCFIFFPYNTQNVILILYLIGIAMAIMTGLLMSHSSDTNILDNALIIELPNYKIPKLRSILIGSILRTKAFILGAGKMIIMVFLIMHILINTHTFSRISTNNDNLITAFGKKNHTSFLCYGIY